LKWIGPAWLAGPIRYLPQGRIDAAGAFIEQRIRHGYPRQRPTPLPSRTARCGH
jgi:hypothetical protein